MSDKSRADILRDWALARGVFHRDEARDHLQRFQREPVSIPQLRSAINSLQHQGYLLGLGKGYYQGQDIKAQQRRYFELVRLVCFGAMA